jgi:exonuclease III
MWPTHLYGECRYCEMLSFEVQLLRQRRNELRLVSWNILKGGGARAPQIIEQLSEWNPDIVGLSEFRGTKSSQSIASALTDMGLIHQQSTINTASLDENRLLLASRLPLRIERPQGVPDAGRLILARVDTKNPWTLCFLWVPNRGKGGEKYEFQAATVRTLKMF